MSIQEALGRLILGFEEVDEGDGTVRVKGLMRFGKALEGPPARLHGGHHAFVRAFPILNRVTIHDQARTFPCSVDVSMQRGLRLEESVAFEATYRSEEGSWQLCTRFDGTDRLVAHVQSTADLPLMDASELERWLGLYVESSPSDDSFDMFGIGIHLSPKLVWLESQDPVRTLPESQHAALVETEGTLGPSFISTQLDTVGATARGAIMRHPHFTTHIEILFATGRIPAETHLLCMADRTRIVEDVTSEIAPVEIDGQLYGTAKVPVALVDAAFERVFATGIVTVHPVDPGKFEALKKLRQLRKDR